MRLEPLCTLDLRYRGGFHLVRPYGNESGLGWGTGDGTVIGDLVSGTATWSNQPSRRGDGAMLPQVRGVITTADGAVVLFDLTGRTIFVERDGQEVGRQIVTVMFESEAEPHRWLNDVVCIGDGAMDPVQASAHISVFRCISEI